MATHAAQHWQQVYGEKEAGSVSWHEPVPQRSLELIEATGIPLNAGIVDVGGGTSALARHSTTRATSTSR